MATATISIEVDPEMAKITLDVPNGIFPERQRGAGDLAWS